MDQKDNKQIVTPTVSRILDDGTLIELVFDARSRKTSLVLFREGNISIVDSLQIDSTETLVPISPNNNLLKHEVILLPEKPEEYGSTDVLLSEIRAYLHRYVDLSEGFSRIASAYILLTWAYDAFKELPYLRFRGDFGTGKTRALLVIGSLCHKAFFASGASTVSPIFHTLDTFKGTLIFDEADFRFSDEKAELVKILNNGNAQGFPVLRTSMTPKREFDPRAFTVFGPKIVAMRGSYDDRALESRFITEAMGIRKLRNDIPINLPDDQKEEAKNLRNKLLMYRLRNRMIVGVNAELVDRSLDARLSQVLIPLFSIADDEKLHVDLRQLAALSHQDLQTERSLSIDGEVLQIVSALFAETEGANVSVKEITAAFIERFGNTYDRPITYRYIGHVLRKRLQLLTYKSAGVYVVPISQKPKIEYLCEKYGIEYEYKPDPGKSSDSR